METSSSTGSAHLKDILAFDLVEDMFLRCCKRGEVLREGRLRALRFFGYLPLRAITPLLARNSFILGGGYGILFSPEIFLYSIKVTENARHMIWSGTKCRFIPEVKRAKCSIGSPVPSYDSQGGILKFCGIGKRSTSSVNGRPMMTGTLAHDLTLIVVD
ncbi:hypothetical protein RJ639_036608 [Escallonia herrerae]|uniref:Uncharacterized protein n=1 Tax=Escallonia herrerae TaxID=1293975 RepID=A0AA88WWY3_9ASTE|nr:hypothetical protein RJ639_036608 [Escallonia herrerae]